MWCIKRYPTLCVLCDGELADNFQMPRFDKSSKLTLLSIVVATPLYPTTIADNAYSLTSYYSHVREINF